MVKIIQPGRIPEEVEHRAQCNRCGCVFDFKATEAKLISDQRDGNYYTITCPQTRCGHQVTKYPDPVTRYERPRC